MYTTILTYVVGWSSAKTCEQADIDSKKGVTGTNVASALFWLPGLAYTYYDAGEAQRLINERKSGLTKMYNDKKCVR